MTVSPYKDVFLNKEKNEISLTHIKNENICIGRTDSDLKSFLEFMKNDWMNRGLDIANLPKITN